MVRYLKIFAVVIGAVVLTTLGISASDTLQGVGGSLLSNVITSETPLGCGADAVEVSLGEKTICVDRFEASAGDDCAVADPQNLRDSDRNLGAASCAPVSKEGALPWRFVNLSQAQRACASAGKRLPTNAEWYRAALGTQEGECNLNDPNTQSPAASHVTTCRSTAGAYNMLGNVWEWVDEAVASGSYDERKLPVEGYVAGVDQDGVALETVSEKGTLYGDDYFWALDEGARGMIRGGFYGSGNDGGIYALNAAVELSFGSPGVGFRCVRDL